MNNDKKNAFVSFVLTLFFGCATIGIDTLGDHLYPTGSPFWGLLACFVSAIMLKRSIARLDARATKSEDTPAKAKSKKDTKKWCKGKEGVEHKLVCEQSKTYAKLKELICTTCGKKLDWY